MSGKESIKKVAEAGEVPDSVVYWGWRLLPKKARRWLSRPGVMKRLAAMIATMLALGGISGYTVFLADEDRDLLSANEEPWCDNNTWDSDGDGLSDGEEVMHWGTDPCKVDTDGDNLTDSQEVIDYLTSPTHGDTDKDGLLDGEDPRPLSNVSDVDGDGVLDQWDKNWSTNLSGQYRVEGDFTTNNSSFAGSYVWAKRYEGDTELVFYLKGGTPPVPFDVNDSANETLQYVNFTFYLNDRYIDVWNTSIPRDVGEFSFYRNGNITLNATSSVVYYFTFHLEVF